MATPSVRHRAQRPGGARWIEEATTIVAPHGELWLHDPLVWGSGRQVHMLDDQMVTVSGGTAVMSRRSSGPIRQVHRGTVDCARDVAMSDDLSGCDG
jgi:hypothetical protein